MAKKDVASKFRNAAKAATAFKPRAKGGAARFAAALKDQPADGSKEPDGITGVVPAPGLMRAKSSDNTNEAVEEAKAELDKKPSVSTTDLPSVTISSPITADAGGSLNDTPVEAVRGSPEPPPAPKSEDPPAKSNEEKTPSLIPEAPKTKTKEIQEAKQRRRRSNQHTKYLTTLGVDPGILDGRGLDFESALGDFGWGDSARFNKKIDVLEVDVRRDLGRVEAGSWLGHLEQKDDRVELVERMLDRAITECDELEGLLTLYGVELSVSEPTILFGENRLTLFCRV
jgi:exocyst complex component 1